MSNRVQRFLSVLALTLGGFVTAHVTGLLPMNDFLAEFLSDSGSLLALAGVPIFVLPATTAKVLMVLSGLAGAAVTGHLAHPMSLDSHGWSVFFKFVGLAGIVMGVLGRSALGGGAKPLPPLDGPPPAPSSVPQG